MQESRGKKRISDFWKKGRVTKEEYKDVVRSCREKIRKAKAQLELSLVGAMKGNRKCFRK